MKIKLIKAMGIFMTAGMLASMMNPATVGAGKLSGGEGIDIQKSAEDERKTEEAEISSVSVSDEEKVTESEGGRSLVKETAEPDISSSSEPDGAVASMPDATAEPVTSSSPNPEETEKPVISSSPKPEETERPATSSTPEPEETAKPDMASSPRPEETIKQDASPSPRPEETIMPGTSSPMPDISSSPRPGETDKPMISQSPKPGETVVPSPSALQTLPPSPSPSASSQPNEEYYYEPVTGVMVKGPRVLSDGKKLFYDTETGKLVKGDCEINGVVYHFDETDGHLIEGEGETSFWLTIDGSVYRYQEWERQGWHPEDPEYLGEEIYDPEADAWCWLDGLNQGRVAMDKDVYIESQADEEGNIGKWVRYDENGHMVRGWSKDEMYYFDPIYGTMAKGKVLIDGVEYEFDGITGRRILKQGFEEYGIQCNVEAGVEYDYVTCSYADEFTPVHGKAVFDYTTFETDDTHEAKEGYEWKRVVVSLAFEGDSVEAMGCKANLLYDLDYYTFNNMPLSKAVPYGVTEKERTVRIEDAEYQITTQYRVLENSYGGDADVRIVFSYECHVPVGYDGVVVALCNAANQNRGDLELDRMDSDSLIFRLK